MSVSAEEQEERTEKVARRTKTTFDEKSKASRSLHVQPRGASDSWAQSGERSIPWPSGTLWLHKVTQGA